MHRRPRRLVPLTMLLAGMLALALAPPAHAAVVAKVDWDYGDAAEGSGGEMTGQKPESKLWLDPTGRWWSVMVPPGGGPYHFYTLSADGQTWQDQGLGGDDRQFTKPDVLVDGSKLYIASRDGSATKQNRLYRYSFNGSGFNPAPDPGFPVNIAGGGAETLTIAKDSTGKLWIAWEAGGKVKVNRSTGTDTSWGSPFTLPVTGANNLKSDDIAAVQAFNGRIGVMWSNQNTQQDYFAYHTDGTGDTTGWTGEVAYSGSLAADDHLNLKTDSNDGTIWAAVKTSKNDAPNSDAEPVIVLLHRSTAGSWSASTVWTGGDQPTRPICLLDETNGKVYVLAQVLAGSPDGIYLKVADQSAPSFAGGLGTPLIRGSGKPNNVSSTKQNLSPATGLVALASTSGNNDYWHARMTF